MSETTPERKQENTEPPPEADKPVPPPIVDIKADDVAALNKDTQNNQALTNYNDQSKREPGLQQFPRLNIEGLSDGRSGDGSGVPKSVYGQSKDAIVCGQARSGTGDGKPPRMPYADDVPPQMPDADGKFPSKQGGDKTTPVKPPPDGKDKLTPPPADGKGKDVPPPPTDGKTKDTPTPPADGKDKTTPPGTDKVDKQGKVERDADGKIKSIEYPGGKTRSFEYDGKELKSMTTKDQKGERTMTREGDKWSLDVDGMKLPLPGKIQVNNTTGDVSFQTGNDGQWRTEKTDNTVAIEKSNALGARFTFDKSGKNLEGITRTDGSSVSAKFTDGKMSEITETRPGQDKPTTWKKDGDTWKSDGKPPQERKNFEIDKNGNTSFDTADGIKHIVRGNGAELNEGPGKAKFKFDDNGRISQIDYPDGKKARGFGYDEKTGEVNRFDMIDKEKKETISVTKGKGGDDWNMTKQDGSSAGTWSGKVKIGDDGTYSLLGTGKNAPADGKWTSNKPDGTVLKETISETGARSSYDKDGQLRGVTRRDGSTVDSNVGKDGKINQIIEANPKTGEKTTWNKDDKGNWKSDSAKNPETRKDMSFNKEGEMQFSGDQGKFTVKNDGTKVLDKPDRSKIEYNKNGTIDRTIAANGDQRKFEYDKDGGVSKITDTNKKDGSTKSWDKNDPKAEKRDKLNVNKDTGDVSWEKEDKSAVIQKSNMSQLELNKDGQVTKATQANGSTRELKYKDGQLDEIKDTRKGSKGDKVETWKRDGGDKDHPTFKQVDDAGKPVKDKAGKERVREDMQVRSDGDLEYKGGDGKIKSMRAPGRDGGDGFSNDNMDVEAARDSMMEAMKEHLDGPRMERFEKMVKQFEDRMANRTEERKLAGVKTNDEIDAHHQKTVAETYNSIAEMVSNNDPNATYDQKTRAKLAENFMYHAQEPMTVDQGTSEGREKDGHGTCWISSAQIWGLTQHPGAMADYLKQISLNGEYTTKNSGTTKDNPLVGKDGESPARTVKFSKDYLSFAGKQENDWSVSAGTEMWRDIPGGKRQSEGDRSPVSRIFDSTLPLLGKGRKEGDIDGGNYESFTTVGGQIRMGNKDLLHMVTGDTPADRSYAPDSRPGHLIDNNLAKTMLEKGSVLNYSPGHLKSQTIRKMADGSYGYFQDNQHGESDDKQIGKFKDSAALAAWAKGDKSALETFDKPKAVDYKQFKVPSEGDFGPVKVVGPGLKTARR